MTAIDRKVQESQTDSAAFWRNLYRSFADTARGAESLGVKAVQAVRGIPGMSGMEEWYSNNIAPLQGVKDTFDGQRQLFDRYEQRREALNTMQDVMHEFGQRMRGTSPDASWYVKAINGAGNITGQSLSYMAPGGWALVLAGDMGHAGNAASRNGDSLVDVTINGLRNTVEEKGFGVFSVFGRMGAINKLMTRTGTGALARLAAKVPGRTFFAGTRTGKMLSTPAFAYVEEMAAEPLAGELFEWTARKLSGMTGMEVKPKDFEVVGPVLQAMGDVEQSGGCALFVAAMAAGHAPRMKQEVAAFVTDAQRAQLAGYTKKHAEEMASFSTAEHKAALAQKYFETDVLKDPEGAAERARKAGAELADRQEARLYQMSGALDKVLEKANIGRIRKLEGTDRYEVSLREGAVVNGVKMEEDRSVEMNEEQTDALVQVVLQGAYLNGVRVMQDAVLGNAAISEAGKMDFIETLDMLSEEAPAEYRKAAAETGGMTVPGLMDVAARAQARIDAIVREEGVSVQEARSRTDAEVMGKVQLGSIADLAAAFERRLDHAVRSGEITRGRADEIKSGTAAASFAHRFTMAADPGSSLLLYAGGHATTANVMEDVQESALVHYMNLTGKDWQDLWEHLQAADAVLGRYGVSLGTYEGPAHDARDVVESFSNLSLSSSLADIESLPVPQWVKDTAEFALKNLEDSARIIRMGEQWNEFAATDEGKKFMEEHGGLADALQAVGVSTESVFRQARMDAAQKLDVEMVHADLASRRAPGDATMTLGELEALEESMARMDAAEDVEETAEEEDETDPVTGIAGNSASPAPLVEDAGGSLEGVGEEAEHDEEAGAEFRDHAFVRVAPDCVFAQVRVDSLALAPDVEQFKQGDHNERGAVKGRELQGRFREDAQPISVWRRRDGTLHVITGRHRFDLAVRDGVEFIPAYVYEEDDAHDATWAKMHDVGQNMLDGQASALEVAFFVRNSNMGRDEMEAQGYLRPGSANVMGWDIATLAGDEVFTRLKNGVITDNEAWKVCRLSSTEAGQMLALQLREKGKPWDYVAAYVKEADRVAAEKSREGEAFDLFGNDTSWQEDCEKVARFAARGIALIAERLSLLKKSRGISRRKDLAGRMGIRLETDADLNAAIHDLERAKGAWQSHDPALRLHDRALAWDGTSEVNPFERVPVSGATFSVVAMDSSGTVLAPETFVTREDGSPDWFVIPRRKRQPAMPVRLLVGSDVGEHRGYGLTHILASRGFSFWKDRSPERYISSILANVSELYEVAPGRELLVKGRQPSSWMLLQLDRKDGFYSIVSAYPVRQGKKPLGKKLPLAERQPANANSGTARLGPGSASKAALPSQSAGGGDGFSLPQGAHVVNVNEVECRFDDGAIVPATFSLSLEKETIRKKAVADGTFMKAPNGKDTNLTEDQWLSVRTEAFKNWFGDWEKDPQNASKVVDENGEPRVVYHGSHQWFTSFNDGKQRQQSGAPAGTIFANDNREIAVSFADYYGGHADEVILDPNDERHPRYSWGIYREGGIYDLFMNIRNPLVVDFEGRPWLDSSKGGDINALCSKAKESGHDGVIALNIVDVGLNDQENVPASTDYVAFDSVQVKSATQNRGTYDPKNPDITFSIVSAQDQGLFHDGHFEAGNAVITEPGVTFSITALHASPHSFRKFSTDFMGKGEGAQAYGWGLYFAENPKVNRSYMNQFAQDKATWKFREVETGVIEVMQRSLVGSFLPKDALPEAKEDASDIAWSVLGDLVDAARGSMTVLDIVMELHDEIDTNRKYAETYPQEREKLEQLEGFMLSLLDHLDEIEVRTGMPSNYRVELNVEDSELMGWDYVDETVLALLKDSPVEEVRYALERAERRADYRGENVSGKDVYQELFDAFWDGEDGTKQEAQKAASVSLLSSDIKGIKYADGYTRNKAEEEQTYNYVIFDGNDIKITAFADESTGGAWADYEDPTATFSLSEGFPRRVSRGTQNLEVVHRIAADLRADAATWGRYDGKTDEAAFLVNVGRNVALVKSALMHLPAGYRVAVKPYIDRLQILAELAAKGKIDETRMVNAFARREIKREMAEATREGMEEAEITARVTAAGTAWEKGKKPTQKFAKEVFEDEMEKVRKAWAEKRLHELMAEVMEKAAGKLEALAKDGVSAGMARMLDQVLTIRKKNGKQQKGKVSMEAYAYLTDQVVPLLRMTAMEKEAAMNEAAAELDKLEKENPDQMDGEAVSRMEELREELTRLALYGNLEGMSVDEAQAAAKALEIYINTEKEGWAAVQEAAAERLNAIGRRIVERFNQTGKKADENTLRAANEKFHGKVSFKNFGDFMENMDQLLTRMGTMPALQEFTTDMRSRLTNAFQQMRDARGLRAAAVQDLYEKHLTEKVMKARKVGNMAGWVTWFKTSHDTKVRLNGWITQTARLTLEQAREVREMDARQRKEFIRKRWEEGMEYFSEETLDLLLARLREHEEAAARARAEGRRPVYRKYVTAKASFKGEEGSPLVLSRDNALYLVLQSEQEDYREMMKQQGYTPEVISALREYVGEEGMAIGYGLRELLKAQGDKIGKLYEQVTGVPFPRVENYFPARFWALDAMSDADAADMISGVPSTKGGNQGWQRVRTKHHRRLDTSVGALSVFWEATDMTDHWYYTQDITADFRGLLRRREVAESLVANLGKDDFVRLRRWVDLLERAGVVQGQAVGSLDKLLNAVYSGQAKAILAFRFETLMKQGSAVLNAWIGDPSIGFWDYLGTMAKMRNGTAEMGVIKMMKSAEFQARLNDRVDVETLSRLRDDSSYTLAEAALVWGMNGIEYTDVFFNAVGSAALWNIKYRQAVKAGVEEGRAKDEAWQAVRNALHSAQPQTWIDKSFGGLHRGAWGRAIFYMMSENYNKTAAIYGLARAGFAPGVTPKQRWASLSKAGKVWLAYGAFNAIIGAMLDYMKDDEEEWEKRDWQGYLFAALAGPIAGMPLVGEAVEWLFSELLGAKVYTGSAGRALIDFRSGWNAAWKLGEMMQEGGHEAGDYMKQVIRLGRVFGAAGGIASGMANKTIQTAGQYMTLGAALMNPVKTVADVVD